MRDILFRGKRADTGEWLYGNFASVDRDAFIISRTTEPDTENGGSIPSCITVNPATVGQYVGMADRNGQQIFEGDIVGYVPWTNTDAFRKGIVKYGTYRNPFGDSYDRLGFCIEWFNINELLYLPKCIPYWNNRPVAKPRFWPSRCQVFQGVCVGFATTLIQFTYAATSTTTRSFWERRSSKFRNSGV